MGKLIYSMSVSADGYIVGPDGKFDWAMPDEEQHRVHNEQTRALAGHLLGRRLYETMVYWETADQDPAASDVTREFASIWQALPKVVFSTTLENVEGNTTLARDSVPDEVRRLKQLDGDIAVGGAELAAACIELDLVDEYGLFVHPVIVGGGRPFFPSTDPSVELELVDTRSFASQVVYLRYRRSRRA